MHESNPWLARRTPTTKLGDMSLMHCLQLCMSSYHLCFIFSPFQNLFFIHFASQSQLPFFLSSQSCPYKSFSPLLFPLLLRRGGATCGYQHTLRYLVPAGLGTPRLNQAGQVGEGIKGQATEPAPAHAPIVRRPT